MKKRVSALLMASLLVCGATACGGGNSGGGNDNGINKGDRSKSFSFSYYASGYGSEWIKAVTEDYMLNVDTDVYIETTPSFNNESARTDISSDGAAHDLYRIEVGMGNYAKNLTDLTDLFEMEVPGEEGVLVKDKIGAEWCDYYNHGTAEDPYWYEVPNTPLTGWNWVYNKTLLDSIYPDGYDLPNTTNEFLAFGADLYNNKVYLTGFAGDDTQGGEYLPYAHRAWFAQMLGKEGYDKYYTGYYYDETAQDWVFCKDGPKMIETNRVALEETYKFIVELSGKTGGVSYMHPSSKNMKYLDINTVFYGGRFQGVKTQKMAFHYVGGWLETEVEPLIGVTIEDGQEVRAMPMPVMSSIIKVLPDKTITDDAMLSAVVDAIDAGETSYEGVSAADFQRVKEARKAVTELICRSFVIPKTAKNKDEIKEFLAYLVSDRAQMIAAKATQGISPLPYGYVPTDEDMGFAISEYTKSVQAVAQDAFIVDYGNENKKFATTVGIEWCSGSGGLSYNLYGTTAADAATLIEQIYTKTYNANNSDWANKIKRYEAAIS